MINLVLPLTHGVTQKADELFIDYLHGKIGKALVQSGSFGRLVFIGNGLLTAIIYS